MDVFIVCCAVKLMLNNFHRNNGNILPRGQWYSLSAVINGSLIMPEYARVCQSMPEYARVCQSMPEYARVYQSVPECARVLPSFPQVVPKSSQDGLESAVFEDQLVI